MVELDQFKYTLSTYDETLKEVKDSLDLENKERRITELDKSMEEPGFWDDPERSTKTVREAKNLKDTVDGYKHLEQQYEDIQVMIQMGYEENDSSLIPEIEEMLEQFKETLENMRMKLLLSGEYDSNNAILRLNAGAGGTESCDWCSILYRMYCRWAESKGFKAHVLDFLDGEEAGIKSVTVQIDGENAYGYLRSEHGVHRLVRISPFNSAGKRQTSFVSCDVMPNIEEDIDIEVNPDDIRVDTYRSSGAGGQHIQKTESAVRITHLPTGIVVECQDERSQHKNKERAMGVLISRIHAAQVAEVQAKESSMRKSLIGSGDRSERIRTYNYPQGRVTDHRINLTLYKLDSIMDGDLDCLISPLTTEHQAELLAALAEGE